MPFIDDWGTSLYRITGRPEDEIEQKFDVYQRYLEQWKDFIIQKYTNTDNFITFISEKLKSVSLNQNKLDLTYIQRFLFIAWNTEYLLSLNDGNSNTDILRVNNQWKPIQAYYSIYSLEEAMVYCVDKKIENHAKCHQKINDFFVSRKNSNEIEPWNFAFSGYTGNKKTPSTIKSVNFPSKLVIPNALQVYVTPTESIACCLQAEHRNRIESWTRPQKSKTYKYQYDPGFTTLFNFLYKLRVKSNYKDAETFMVEAPTEKIKAFSDDLTFLVHITNMLLENIIIKKIGETQFYKLASNFESKNTDARITERVKKYKALL